MCIAIFSTAHPDYPLILLSNRDEFLHRPTAPASWWDPPNDHVLGGRDLHREVHGTWLGITRQGRIAVLTNFREEGTVVEGARSRGAIVNSFLTTPPDSAEMTEEFAKRLVEEDGVTGVGGFSLLFGRIGDLTGGVAKKKKGLAIISNRTPDVKGLIWVAREAGETHGLSNSHYGDNSWPKVNDGERLLREAIERSVQLKPSQDEFITELFGILSVNKLPAREANEEWEVYLRQLRNSIFIPPIGGVEIAGKPADEIAAAGEHKAIDATSGLYGTQKQSVILVDTAGQVTFIERTLVDDEGRPLKKDIQDRRFQFNIENL